MPRSTGSKQPQAAAGGGSPHTAPVPKNAVNAIQRFLGGNLGLLMLLQCLCGPTTPFNWKNYKASPKSLPEGQLTAEIVVTWLLTFLFRKPVLGDAAVTDQVCHRFIVFLRENRECKQLRPLFGFLKNHQKHIYDCEVIPRWVQIVLCPICNLDGIILSNFMKNGFTQPHQFWQNILQGLTLSLLPFWLNEQKEYVMQYLLFELLQQTLTDEVRGIIHTFLREKPAEFFSKMPADLLIMLNHHQVISENQLLKTLFDESRRSFIDLQIIFLYGRSLLEQDVCRAFFKKHFFSIFRFLENTPTMKMSFHDAFVYPHLFFHKLIETRDLLETSGVQIHEMWKYMNLYCWKQTTFFPTSLKNSYFFNHIIQLPNNWKNLFVQLWRIDVYDVSDSHIFALVKFVRRYTNCLFSSDLVEMLKIFMRQIVENAPLDDKKAFFDLLLRQDIAILTHFLLTPDLVQFCLTNFPDPSTKATLFWWLFMVQSSLKYQGPERDLKIDMDEVCQMMGLNISEEELGLVRSREPLWQKIAALAQMFNVITLVFKFGTFTSRQNFTSATHCDHLSLIGIHPFRALVHGIKSSFNLHLKPNDSFDKIRTLVSACEAKKGIILQMDEEDRKFLKELFSSYLGKLVLSEELVQLLHQLSQVFPVDVKQHMFEACLPLKMLDVEKAKGKRSRDLTDPDSYEADCSRCRRPHPLTQLGLDGFGAPICWRCSQSCGIVIVTIPSGLPFANFGN